MGRAVVCQSCGTLGGYTTTRHQVTIRGKLEWRTQRNELLPGWIACSHGGHLCPTCSARRFADPTPREFVPAVFRGVIEDYLEQDRKKDRVYVGRNETFTDFVACVRWLREQLDRFNGYSSLARAFLYMSQNEGDPMVLTHIWTGNVDEGWQRRELPEAAPLLDRLDEAMRQATPAGVGEKS